MISRLLSVFSALVILTLVVYGGIIKDGSFTASSDGTNIRIRWASEDEVGVARYELERMAGVSGSFFLLVQISPKGNNSSYEFVDETALRLTESIYKYQLKVVFANNDPPLYYGPITVSHNPSSVRRTWGSIKAMFR
ncbi:MAG: hypothetical protein HY708_05130 [Ignavibacteriae bacterium]|nr:hypothetical protein [Ignavibacteriota bacterium]